ncbi:5-deoxy-glucuronate isomerase [Actomonas aquatica]|uniref:5-deoxy-glucuronate isomerase n=1 Tax=Actomonas aquatica TaxID=2866162 RepID=A0ABZ1C8V6_9BACT|nr:5-deoxy-glucuronate isomerase [Opitutus sp. WL0086]WRQ87842.1 5-deoxy-glucuronate isomerase [Opitutus sp. WL0086]
MPKNRTVNSSSCRVPAPASSTAQRFPLGHTAIVTPGSKRRDPAETNMDFGILRLRRGQRHSETCTVESVFVLLHGEIRFRDAAQEHLASRASLFDEDPSTYHCGAGTELELKAGTGGAELAVIRSSKSAPLPTRFTPASAVDSEDRGAGLVQGACRRCVRTIFDYNTRPDSDLVVGEVVNYPGRWSSYPPHHHAQPEIYHYRFTDPRGYGHAELGDDVLKVRHGDTVGIPGGLDHAQVSAPGYGMYYLWVVHHLPRRPYKGFKFTPAHTWLLDAQQQGWQPTLPASR